MLLTWDYIEELRPDSSEHVWDEFREEICIGAHLERRERVLHNVTHVGQLAPAMAAAAATTAKINKFIYVLAS